LADILWLPSWFTFNFEFNIATVFAYYIYMLYRFYKVKRADTALQRQIQQQREMGDEAMPSNIRFRKAASN